MNSIASVVNFINFDVNVAGYTNIVNHYILSAHSVESIDPSALLRGEACIKLKSDTYGGAPLREFFRAIQSHRPREPLERGNKDRWYRV